MPRSLWPNWPGTPTRRCRSWRPSAKAIPLPTFVSRGVEVVQCRTMGNGAQHLRLKLKHRDSLWDAVAFKFGDSVSQITSSLDIVYNLELDRWNGADSLRLNILSFNSG